MLARLGLSRYLENCRRECIDDACLDTLERDDIRELGLPIGPARQIRGRARRPPEKPRLGGSVSRDALAAAPRDRARQPPRRRRAPLPAPPRGRSGETLWPTGRPVRTLCEICMDAAVAVRLECAGAHEFCVDCLDRWAQQTALKAQAHTSCPTCRAPVVRPSILPLEHRVPVETGDGVGRRRDAGSAGSPTYRGARGRPAAEAAERERAAAAALAEREHASPRRRERPPRRPSAAPAAGADSDPAARTDRRRLKTPRSTLLSSRAQSPAGSPAGGASRRRNSRSSTEARRRAAS